MPDKTLALASQRLKTHDYPILIKRLDQSSITINLRNGSKEVDDLLRILQVRYQCFSRCIKHVELIIKCKKK